MKPFTYERATSVADALKRAGDGATFLAGGTNLIDHLRLGIRATDRLIDISHLELSAIDDLDDGGLRIGAMARNSDLAAHRSLRQRFPFVSEALLAGASGQLRNMATVGGNLMQRTRCIYFQDLTTPCNKRDPGSGCSAIDGFGRYNALIGASDSCVATHPSDLCVPLAAVDAVVEVEGAAGVRRIDFADFHRLPGRTPDVDTTLGPDELITAVELPALGVATRSRYRKVRERASYAFALVSVAAALEVVDGVVSDVRLALGGVSHRPHRARVAEGLMRERPATTQTYREAIEAELAEARPGPHNAVKVPILRNTVVNILEQLQGSDPR